MQLLKIKIAGFKTFVDPTVINLPGKRVAIVGPNGCGKSNIIDAVTWVMGESSPKYLRGEALTDVIFNGSSARKPVGQASVELVFDNADGTISGEYAKYNEISVKRVINRDSDSTYYLNGTRCRKRDIVDIFLGTGLGPRSYSIIGQNMISRIIEAKPDDLRTYLEEAAGISKYKERRHETELRIQHTKENLSRVNDLRIELDKQLSHLKHQANVAEKYKVLKQQERVLQAELYAIEWRQLDARMIEHTLTIQREETGLEARLAQMSGADREIEQLRHEQRVAQDAYQEVQRRYYAVGNEITRIEQDILHQQERQTQWENDLKQSENDWQAAKDQMAEAEEQSRELAHAINRIEPELAKANEEAQSLEVALKAAEEAMLAWQSRSDEFNQTHAKLSQKTQVEKTHIEHLEKTIAYLEKHREQLESTKHRYNFDELDKEIAALLQKSYEVADRLQSQTKQLNDLKDEQSLLETSQVDASANLDNVRSELQRLRGQQASLQALQQTALGQRNNPVSPWLAKHDLANKQRLAQHIDVEQGYEVAVEKALGFCLQGICVDKISDITTHLADFESGKLYAFTSSSSKSKQRVSSSTKGPLLAQKIKSSWPVDMLLAGVYTADSLEEALKLCESLDEHESVMTRDGIWVNRAWIRILREEDPAAGVFKREQELKQLAARITHLEATQDELQNNIAKRREKIQELAHKRDQAQQVFNTLQAQSVELQAQQKMKQERVAEWKEQSERFLKQQAEYVEQLRQAQHELSQAQILYQQAQRELDQQTASREALAKDRDVNRQAFQAARDAYRAQTDHIHELEIRLETSKSQKESLQHNAKRISHQLAVLGERRMTLKSELSSMQPLDNLKKALSRALDKHVSAETELNTARIAVESLEHESRNLEEKRQAIERDINKIRNGLETLRVESQGWKVKAETVLEQLRHTGFTLEDILKELAQNISVDEWQSKLDQVTQRINRLGAINLVAIDEYATCLERKQYLDKQLEDLQSGLNTLEDAIAKIDRETKNRFKETFDKVNERFQALFPTVFGGGRAYLALTSDDLLEAGVTVMATPPGKRNSSIYLLSGGEKSLTAIALIFSIFDLNPAPFCLLDEVDAALDDANVLRFTRLVKTMSEKIQFLFISHNKITIEMAEHLIGVTMNEPGVSRLVSVDIEKAMSLAGVEPTDV